MLELYLRWILPQPRIVGRQSVYRFCDPPSNVSEPVSVVKRNPAFDKAAFGSKYRSATTDTALLPTPSSINQSEIQLQVFLRTRIPKIIQKLYGFHYGVDPFPVFEEEGRALPLDLQGEGRGSNARQDDF